MQHKMIPGSCQVRELLVKEQQPSSDSIDAVLPTCLGLGGLWSRSVAWKSHMQHRKDMHRLLRACGSSSLLASLICFVSVCSERAKSS
eukprot:5204595-Amphidinium_carterae.1